MLPDRSIGYPIGLNLVYLNRSMALIKVYFFDIVRFTIYEIIFTVIFKDWSDKFEERIFFIEAAQFVQLIPVTWIEYTIPFYYIITVTILYMIRFVIDTSIYHIQL